MIKAMYDESLRDELGWQVLFYTSPFIVTWGIVSSGLVLWLRPEEHLRIYPGLITACFMSVSYALAWKGRGRLGINILFPGFLFALLFAMYFNGGVRAPYYTVSMCLLAFASWFYRWDKAILLWAFLLGLGVAFLALHQRGLLPEMRPLTAETQFLFSIAQFTGILIVCLLPARMLHAELILRKRKQQESESLVEQLRQQKRTLAQRERELHEAQRIAKLGYWTRDMATGGLTWSDEMFALLGIDRQPMTMEAAAQFIHPDDARTLPEQDAVTPGQQHEIEFRIVRLNGEIRWVYDKFWGEFDDEGKEIKRHGISQDITARKRGERLLELEARLSRQLLQANDLDSLLQLCVSSAISGTGLDCGGIYIEDDRHVLRLAYSQGLSQEFIEMNTFVSENHPGLGLLRQGAPIHARYAELRPEPTDAERAEDLKGIAVIPIMYNDSLIGCLNVASHTLDDIPEISRHILEITAHQIGGVIVRAKAHAALEKSEERFRQLVETSYDTIWETDVEGHVLYASPQTQQVTGYTLDELRSMNIFDLIDEDSQEKVRNGMAAALRSKTIRRNIVTKWHHRDGSARWLETNATVVQDSGDNVVGFRGSNRDITGRMLAEENRVKLEEQCRQAQKMEAVGQLAGGVAHDFNNLLQVILGAGTIALEDMEEYHKARKQVTLILRAEEKAARLVEQLLAFSRRQVMRPQLLSLNDAVAELLKMVQRLIGAHITLKWIAANEECLVFADRTMLEQVVLNLCVNARDAMPGGGELAISTHIANVNADFCAVNDWATPGAYVVLEVRDTGCGMPPDIVAKIFDPFFTTKPLGKGTGLGLSTVYGIVRQHDGMIFAHSAPNAGATFEIYLPEAEPPPERHTEAALAGNTVTGGTETILLAEDNDPVRKVAASFLSRAGYNVIEAANGGEAIERLQENGARIRLAVLDVIMPGLGGRELYDYIQAHFPQIPVIFASGYSEGGIHTNFVLEKGMKLLNKPFKQAELLAVVRGFLDNNPV